MVVVRQLTRTVIFAGAELTDVLSIRGQVVVDSGWPTCSVFVTAKPTTGNEDDGIQVIAGADNVTTRFQGIVRRFRPSGFPKSIEMVAAGTLVYANEWAPQDDTYFDEHFPSGATDQDIVQWALDQVPGITYVAGDIGGTGVVLGTEAPEAFDWKAGTTAWTYIQQIDRATLYRTYQDHLGAIRRVKMIGHPNTTTDFTLVPADMLDGSSGQRNTEQTRNNVRVQGHDFGDGLGPVSATATATPIPGVPDRWEQFQSDLIESGVDPDDGTWDGAGGLRADDIAAAVILDVDKEFVEAQIPSWRDDLHGPGLTCLVDALDRLAIGEPMWVAGYSWELGDSGWQCTYQLTGGGLPQDNPPPPVV
jgi:hypothetical protein